MGDITRMASCSAGKSSDAAARRGLGAGKGEGAKSSRHVALAALPFSSLQNRLCWVEVHKIKQQRSAYGAVNGRGMSDIPRWESSWGNGIGSCDVQNK